MDNSFGNKLRRLREDKNKLQKEVALELNVSYTGYSSYENDLRMPGIKMVIKIADYFNVSTDYLLGRDTKIYIDDEKLIKELEELKIAINLIQQYIKNSK